MRRKSFSLLVPYNQKMVLATANKIESPHACQYDILYPDGIKKAYHTIEADGIVSWADEQGISTDNTRAVGDILDLYILDIYLEPFYIVTSTRSLAIQPFKLDSDATVRFKVFENATLLMELYIYD